MIKKILVGVVSAVSLSVAIYASAEDVDKFVYDRPLRSQDFMSIVPGSPGRRARVEIAPDAYVLAEFCQTTSGFRCVVSQDLVFAVPMEPEKFPDGWEYQGIAFEVVKKYARVSFFGVEVPDVVVIKVPASATERTRRSGEDGYFLYSASKGLLSFGYWVTGETRDRTYFLSGDQGFGARE